MVGQRVAEARNKGVRASNPAFSRLAGADRSPPTGRGDARKAKRALALAPPPRFIFRLQQQLLMILNRLYRLFDKLGSAFRVIARDLAFRAFGARPTLLKELLGRVKFLACSIQQAVHSLHRRFSWTPGVPG